MHILKNYLRRKEILLIFFRHFVELSAKNQPLLDYFRDITVCFPTAQILPLKYTSPDHYISEEEYPNVKKKLKHFKPAFFMVDPYTVHTLIRCSDNCQISI